MPNVVPALLASYLQQALNAKSLTLVTTTLSTPANWVLVRLLYIAFKGLDDTDVKTTTNLPAHRTSHVIFVSVTKSLDLWIELCRKAGLDLTSLLKSKRLTYVDGLSASNQLGPEQGVVKMKSLALSAMSEAILSAAKASSNSATQDPKDNNTTAKPTIIIDGIDVLCACLPTFDLTTVQAVLFMLRSIASALIVTSSADAPLLHSHHDSAPPLERNHAALVSSLAHQSQWVMQLRALGTGSARDVTGVLRVSHGGAYEYLTDQTAEPDDLEWLYQVKGDGSARVWSRGE